MILTVTPEISFLGSWWCAVLGGDLALLVYGHGALAFEMGLPSAGTEGLSQGGSSGVCWGARPVGCAAHVAGEGLQDQSLR